MGCLAELGEALLCLFGPVSATLFPLPPQPNHIGNPKIYFLDSTGRNTTYLNWNRSSPTTGEIVFYCVVIRGGGRKNRNIELTTFSDGCLGSHNDEERSEMRYVMRIAKPRESSRF